MARKTGAIGSTSDYGRGGGSQLGKGGSSIGTTKAGGRKPTYQPAKTYADVPF